MSDDDVPTLAPDFMGKKLFGLIDCNNFYCSCERVFDPRLIGQPIVVLSNNDGCIVARSNEAKQLNIPGGAPYFKVKSLLEQHNVRVFSSNYTLYGDMSARVMAIAAATVPHIEIYSIDECFFDLAPIAAAERVKFCRDVRQKILRWTGIPVSIGLAETKTLAKLANKIGKKDPFYGGVCNLIGAVEMREAALAKCVLDDVWGIGRRRAAALRRQNIHTALDVAKMPLAQARAQMTVTGERLVLELNGFSCIDLAAARPPKRTIMVSRSFGQRLTQIEPIREALASHAAELSRKMCRHDLLVKQVTVFLLSQWNGRAVKGGWNAALGAESVPTEPVITVTLADWSNDRFVLTRAVTEVAERLFVAGHSYRKCGIFCSFVLKRDLKIPDFGDLWDKADQSDQKNAKTPRKRVELWQAVDKISEKYGKHALRLAAEGVGQNWEMKRRHHSPCYTTRLDQLPKAAA